MYPMLQIPNTVMIHYTAIRVVRPEVAASLTHAGVVGYCNALVGYITQAAQ
jgi:hypothetical protein